MRCVGELLNTDTVYLGQLSSAPSSVPSDTTAFYSKTDGDLYKKESSGSEEPAGGAFSDSDDDGVFTLPSGSSGIEVTSAVIGGIQSEYHLAEDPNSPISASLASGETTSISLANTYDRVVVEGTITNTSSDNNFSSVYANGTHSSAYDRVQIDGTENAGVGEIPIAQQSAGDKSQFVLAMDGRWSNTWTVDVVQNASTRVLSNNMVRATGSLSSPLSSVDFVASGGSMDITAAVYGREISW